MLGTRLLLIFAVAWTVGLVLAVAVYAAPLVPWSLWLLASLFVNPYGPYLVLAAVFGVLLAVLVGRLGAPRFARVLGVVCAAAVVPAVMPIATVVGAADSHGVSLSPWGYSAAEDNVTAPDPARSVTYNHVEGRDLKLDVWQPPGDGPHPAVVWVHGGGFAIGQRGEASKWYEWLNQRGYAVFSIDYRLTPPARWNQAPGDVKCAVGWVKGNSEKYHVDPGRVLLAGGSAGGNLALIAGYSAGDTRLPPSCAGPDTSVKAVIAFYPGTDPFDSSGSLADGFGDTSQYTGGAPEAVPLVKPMTFARHDSPPTFIIAGTHDTVVPFRQSLALNDKLNEVGARHTLVGIPYADHIFDFRWGSYASRLARGTLDQFLKVYG